jgi:hypothetical protein
VINKAMGKMYFALIFSYIPTLKHISVMLTKAALTVTHLLFDTCEEIKRHEGILTKESIFSTHHE